MQRVQSDVDHLSRRMARVESLLERPARREGTETPPPL